MCESAEKQAQEFEKLTRRLFAEENRAISAEKSAQRLEEERLELNQKLEESTRALLAYKARLEAAQVDNDKKTFALENDCARLELGILSCMLR
jgi:predicted  nucleic acid-binding Zn-ribbon protein